MNVKWIFCLLAQQPPVSQGLLIHGVSRLHKRRTTVGRTPLDEWSARRRDLYLARHNTYNRQTSLPPVGFEPSLSRRAAADLCLRPRSHWDQCNINRKIISVVHNTFELSAWACGISGVKQQRSCSTARKNNLCIHKFISERPENSSVSVMKNICPFCVGKWAAVCLWTIRHT